MSLFPKVIMRSILIAMALALAPAAAHAAVFIKIEGIDGESLSATTRGMRVTDATTVHEVAVFAARLAGVDVELVSLSWRGRELDGRRTLGSYRVPDREVTFRVEISGAGSPPRDGRPEMRPH